jgi:ribose 5-phosphate isomerase B
MRIAIGSDHRGLAFKKAVMELVKKAGHTIEDMGSYTEASVDYPVIAKKVGDAVVKGTFDRGILICGTGIGMCIAANKVKGIRAAMAVNTLHATRARLHNDANILCLGAENDHSEIPAMIDAFLNSKFEGGHHIKRLEMLKEMEK